MAEWVDWMALYDTEAKEREAEKRKARRGSRGGADRQSLSQARER